MQALLSAPPRPLPDVDPIASALAAPPAAAAAMEDVAAWWPAHRKLADRHRAPFALSVAGGLAADRAAWAFATGYQAALRALLPGLPDDVLAAFCVTEAGGNRPRDIQTTFRDAGDGMLSITGAKRWSTLGPESTLLLVVGQAVAAPDAPAARSTLRVAPVRADAPGVAIEPMPPTAFVPEVPHARIALQDVRVAADSLLPGDGYDRYVKPFRTIEDTHINAALMAWLLREARVRGWPAAFSERVVAALAALQHVSTMDPASPACHVALTGALDWCQRLYAEAGPLWEACGDPAAAGRWTRDAALFGLASAVREQRALRAWERLDRHAPAVAGLV
ncbi:MAG TPA: acyl-CoA dehydrogenase family protein [Quisquiliibacterium sp.]|nr:acyl-CoA dehydrogenase family protein [Quisquiliibacterium sp.]